MPFGHQYGYFPWITRVCLECGATVPETVLGKHEKWHRKINEAVAHPLIVHPFPDAPSNIPSETTVRIGEGY